MSNNKALIYKSMSTTVQINSNKTSIKEMPHNIEAEQGLLGAILLNNDILFDISEIIEIDHFFEDGLVMQEISSGGGRVVIKKFFFPKERFEELYLIINYKLDYLLLVDSAPRNLLLSPYLYFSTRSEGYVEMEKSGAWTIVTHFCDDETGPCNY